MQMAVLPKKDTSFLYCSFQCKSHLTFIKSIYLVTGDQRLGAIMSVPKYKSSQPGGFFPMVLFFEDRYKYKRKTAT